MRDIAGTVFSDGAIPDNGSGGLRIQASAPLQFVPWDSSCEADLAKKVGGDGNVIAFAAQKVKELVALANSASNIMAGSKVCCGEMSRKSSK